jgi:hypothetical protein
MSRQAGGCGSLLFLVLFCAAIWALVETWPWWLLLFPLVSIVVLATNPQLRNKVWAAFRDEDVDPDTARIRGKVARRVGVLGAIAAFVCLVGAGLSDSQWWLIPIVLLIPAIRLYAMDCRSRKWPLLQRALCDNLLEFIVIAGIVLVVYTIALAKFGALPLNDMTLGKLQGLEEAVEAKHKYLEDHKPGFYMLLTCLFAMFALRMSAKTWPVLRNSATRTMKLIVGAVTWTERASCAAAIAASLTFLATQEDGPLRLPITLSLKNASEDYKSFRGDLRDRADIALRHALVSKAWVVRPPELKEKMISAEEFYRERNEFQSEQSKAEGDFGISPMKEAPFPLAVRVPNSDVTVEAGGVPEDSPSPSWTPADLHKAAGEAKDLRGAKWKELRGENNEEIEEIAKETLDEISPAEKLFAPVPVIELLKTHYPVFGEFVDAVSASISEAAFDRLRNAIVDRVSERRSAEPGMSLAAVVSQEADAGSGTVLMDWSRFNGNWRTRTQERLNGYRTEIARAEVGMENLATEKQQELTERAARSASANVELMTRVAEVTNSASLKEKAVKLKKVVADLLVLGKVWPALKKPSTKETDRLNEISAQIDLNDVAKSDLGDPDNSDEMLEPSKLPRFTTPTIPSLSPLNRPVESLRNSNSSKLNFVANSRASFSTPLGRISECRQYSEMKLIRVVADAAGSAQETRKLQEAMGHDYDVYHRAWQAQVEAERKRREAIVERQREVRMEEMRREQEYRESHPVESEHPMEIP